MAVTLDLLPHPLTTYGREVRPCIVLPGTTLAALVKARWPYPAKPHATVNGRIIPPSDWLTTVLKGGEIITLRTALAGGDSDPLRTLLQIAIMIVAYKFGGPLGSTLFSGISEVAATAVGSTLIMAAGNLVINAIAPIRQPSPGTMAQPEPTYSLTGGANRARPYQPLLLVLGEHRVFPDLGTREYTEIRNNDVYLHQIFHFGLGQLELDDVRMQNCTCKTDSRSGCAKVYA